MYTRVKDLHGTGMRYTSIEELIRACRKRVPFPFVLDDKLGRDVSHDIREMENIIRICRYISSIDMIRSNMFNMYVLLSGSTYLLYLVIYIYNSLYPFL